MESSEYLSNVLGNNRQIIPKFLTIAEEHFTALECEEKVVATEDDIHNVVKVLDLCKMILLEVPITDKLRELVSTVCLLAFNWNKNMSNEKAINTDIKFIRNAVEMHFTMIDMISFTKAVVREAQRRTVTSSGRTDEISRHFLSAIDAVKKEKECDKDICVES
jgi:hypothetical protein